KKTTPHNTPNPILEKPQLQINRGYPVNYNDVPLTSWAVPTLERVAGKDHVKLIPAVTGAEDFSFFAQKVPGFFFFVGGMPLDADPAKTSAHHTPDFYIDESGMLTGLKAMLNLTVEYLNKK
ncbi:MAG: M20/M25/M40 family metallo-hydrolase, partial [Cyclobacteriaceae bacterium]